MTASLGGPPARPGSRVVVVGGGLAGIAAALEAADRGADVTLLERRRRLGGLTWSFEHDGRMVDNGQHVFLRCCEAYRSFLERIGSAGDVELQDRLDVVVARPGHPPGRLRRSGLPAPLHLGRSLLRYPHLPFTERLAIGRAALALRRVDLDDPSLDTETFGSWLSRHGQSPAAIAALWDLITVATVNLPAAEASAAMGAMVFQTGLLRDAAAADVGWSRVPLGRLHGERAGAALARAGVTVRLDERVAAVGPGSGPAAVSVRTADGTLEADAAVVAVPHTAVADLLPPGTVAGQERLGELGTSAIVDVHLTFDRQVMPWPLLAGFDSPIQWVFDRTASSGLADQRRPGRPHEAGAPDRPQYLAVSLSAADHLLGRRPDDLADWVTRELARLVPASSEARVLDRLVTKERAATFRAAPGSARLRPPPRTAIPGVAVAGAWTDTGWPATMEGAVRSGLAAARTALAEAGQTPARTEEVA